MIKSLVKIENWSFIFSQQAKLITLFPFRHNFTTIKIAEFAIDGEKQEAYGQNIQDIMLVHLYNGLLSLSLRLCLPFCISFLLLLLSFLNKV